MANIEEIRKKIDKLINEKGLNYRDTSLKIGRKDSYLQQYIKYGYPRRLKEIDRMRLAKVLGVDDAEIMDDEVLASKTLGSTDINLDVISDYIKSNHSKDAGLMSIDVINSKSCDGVNFLDNTIGQQLLSNNIFNDLEIEANGSVKIVKITDDSMSPCVASGDYVWFDSSYKHPESDGLYLFSIGRDICIRRVQTSPIDGTIEINSDNPQYKPYTTKNKSSINVLGKLLYILHRV